MLTELSPGPVARLFNLHSQMRYQEMENKYYITFIFKWMDDSYRLIQSLNFGNACEKEIKTVNKIG